MRLVKYMADGARGNLSIGVMSVTEKAEHASASYRRWPLSYINGNSCHMSEEKCNFKLYHI